MGALSSSSGRTLAKWIMGVGLLIRYYLNRMTLSHSLFAYTGCAYTSEKGKG